MVPNPVISIFARERNGRFRHRNAEDAGKKATGRWSQRCNYKPRIARNHQKLENAGRVLPENFQREHSPASTLNLDSQPLELRENIFLLF